MATIGNPSDPSTFQPNEEWIEAFTTHSTDEMRVRMKRFAMRWLRGVGRAGVHVDDYAARELVQDILGDTLMGVRAWDPGNKTLQQHVEDVIASRADHLRKRAKRFQHQRIESLAIDAPAHGEIEASLQMDREDTAADSLVFAEEVVAAIRHHAAEDPLVLSFLDAVVAGARTADDVMCTAKLSKKAFRSTRARLRRIVERLDNETIAPLRQA